MSKEIKTAWAAVQMYLVIFGVIVAYGLLWAWLAPEFPEIPNRELTPRIEALEANIAGKEADRG